LCKKEFKRGKEKTYNYSSLPHMFCYIEPDIYIKNMDWWMQKGKCIEVEEWKRKKVRIAWELLVDSAMEKKRNMVRMNDEATHFPMGDLSPCSILIESLQAVFSVRLFSQFSPWGKSAELFREPIIDLAALSHWSIHISSWKQCF